MAFLSDHSALPLMAAALTVSVLLYTFYRSWNGPIAHVPGPTISKFSGVVMNYHTMRGTKVHYLKAMHDKYGPIVRVTPDEVSISDLEATKAVHKTGSGFTKTIFYTRFVTNPIPTLFNSRDPAVHSKWRRLLGNSMSETTLRTLEPVIQSKTNLMISQLRKEQVTRGFMDVHKWFHFFATDVIAELTFGESFRMLEIGKDNQYMEDLQRISRLNFIRVAFTNKPFHEISNMPIWPLPETKRRQINLYKYANEALDRYRQHMAMDSAEPRPMFFNKVMGDKGKQAALSEDEISAQAAGFLVAGTDTTAITGTYTIWSLCRHPEAKQKLLKAISHLPESPTHDELRAIPYLDHVITETLRLYGAAPGALPREVPAGGRTLGGHFIPEGLTASPVAYVLHRNADIYPDPEAWLPERWENPTKAMTDAFLPFGGGSRICIGLHLAKMELRHAVVAFLKEFPDAKVAYGTEGFSDEDMEQLDFFLVKPKGSRCLIK